MSSPAKEPIAIIGIGCRLPGGSKSPEEFWDFLCKKGNGVSKTPADRWDADAFYHPDYTVPGHISVKWGGYIDDIDKFDAKFFNMSPREAQRLDPQQRILLETSYEALEDAGQDVQALSGSDVGVFVGISSHDYGDIGMSASEQVNITGHTITGGAASIASNRISYVFNFSGPSYSVDTACSSSLVAAHNACNSLWAGECSMALVGGVNALIKPETTMSFSRGGFLSPTGSCKAFDAGADGYIRSEGAGMLLLKPLSKAVEDGDLIYTTIVGSALNHDGQTDGISMPSGDAQVRVVKAAHASASISPEQIQYVEAHGTGTAIGDPTEASSLGSAIGAHKSERDPLLIGSVKTNVGHLESASGAVGLIKLALAMKHRVIPGNIHFNKPNPKINFKGYHLKVPTEVTEWPAEPDNMFAGINSFGFGGANAHLILKGYEVQARATVSETVSPQLFTISAKSMEGLTAYVHRYTSWLSRGDELPVLQDICFSAAVRQTHHEVRLTLVVVSIDDLKAQLEAFVRDESRLGMNSGRVTFGHDAQPKLCFVCSGQGPQWWAMGRQLIEKNNVFRKTIETIDKELSKHAPWSLLEELTRGEETSRIGETWIAQPALFAVQVALARTWQSMGVTPDAVVGHSVGEVAASHLSGTLTLEQAVKVVYHRSRIQNTAKGKGKMLAVGLSEAAARQAISGQEDRVSIATINGPRLVTISGDNDVLEKVAAAMDEQDVFHRFLVVDVPFHSNHMDPLEQDLLNALSDLEPHTPDIPLYSTVTGARVDGFTVSNDAAYWYKNVRQPVRFVDAIRNLIRDGYTAFVELSPHPILSRYMGELLSEANVRGKVVGSIRQKQDEVIGLLGNYGALHASGYGIDLGRMFSDHATSFTPLPLYPFQRERYWIETDKSCDERTKRTMHPHICSRTSSAHSPNDHTWDIKLDARVWPYIEDHRVQGPIIFPGAGSCELAIACGRDAFGDDFNFLEDIRFQKAVFLPDEGEPPAIQFDVAHDDGSFVISSRKRMDNSWTRHIQGKLKHQGESFELPNVTLEEARRRCTKEVNMSSIYEELYESGLMLGPSFRAVTSCWRRINPLDDCAGEALGELNAPSSILPGIDQFNIHPAILDACFQVLFGSAPLEEGQQLGVYVPVHIEKLRFLCSPSQKLYCYGRLTKFSPESITGDLYIYDDKGDLCVQIRGFRCCYIEGTRRETDAEDFVYEYQWKLAERASQVGRRFPKNYIAAPSTLANFGSRVVDEIRHRPEKKTYDTDFEPRHNVLSVAYIVDALEKLGVSLIPGTVYSVGELLSSCTIAKGYIQRLFRRCLEILSEYGCLEILSENGDLNWKVVQAFDGPASGRLQAELEENPEYGCFCYELEILGRCGPFLAEVLNGEIDPVMLLFPEDKWDNTVRYYRESYSFKKYNDMIHAIFTRMVADLPPDQTLRVLEIGAGTGGATTTILPILPADRTTYTFTDVSPVFMHKAQQSISREHPFVEFKTLDVTSNVEAQGFIPHSYDIVVASDVVHATPDIQATLANVRKLLAPSGVLVMLEVTQCPWATDLVFGLTEGWWMFEDHDLRPSHPTMSKSHWQEVLKANEFDDVLALCDATSTDVSAQTVFVARNSNFSVPRQEIRVPHALQGPGAWLVFNDTKGVGDHISNSLLSLDEEVIQVHIGDTYCSKGGLCYILDPANENDIHRLISTIRTNHHIKAIVHLWNLDSPPVSELEATNIERAITFGCTSILSILRGLFKDNDDAELPALWIVTSGATHLGDCGELSLAQTPAWGLGRTIMHEYTNMETTMVDVSNPASCASCDSLIEELCAEERAEEVALRETHRYLHRFAKRSWTEEEEQATRTVTDKGTRVPFRLITSPSILGSVHYEEVPPTKPATGEVQIKVEAAALNFKDVLIATGLLPEEAPHGGYTGAALGMECSGQIMAIGEGVSGLKVGDDVVAIASKALGSYAITRAEFVQPKPSSMHYEDAATLPFAYLTAYYCLHHLARMEKGERVLIHAATGGVGLAAVRLAQLAGAEVYATAGSEEKREFLRSMGVAKVMNSRSLDFANEIMEATNGEGVDIVLNSLSGSAIHKSMSVLRKYGRFLEIGKTDIYANNTLTLRPFWNNLSYFSVDIDKLLTEKATLCGNLMKEIMTAFSGSAPPAHPSRVFRTMEVKDAFQFMASARHIGKVVVSMRGDTVQVAPPTDIAAVVHDQCTYLVIGGFSGLGLAVSKWLADNGASHLAIVSRSGAWDEQARLFLCDMESRGVTVLECKADVSDTQSMQEVFKQIRSDMPPIRGIVNSAMVLDDAILSDMNHGRFMAAVRPKVMGAWNLHQMTRRDSLDFFVNFSSISGQYGTPAQSNYAAANTFLDMLSYYRQAKQLTGTTISWGVISGAGFVARNEKVRRMLSDQGWGSLTPAEATRVMGQMILRGTDHRTVADINWTALTTYYPKDSDSHRFGHLVAHEGPRSLEQKGLLAALLETAPNNRLPMLGKKVLETIARILGTSPNKLDPEVPVSNLGLDSLMANQLRSFIQNELDVDFSLMKIMRGPSIDELTKQILELVMAESGCDSPAPGVDSRSVTDKWIIRRQTRKDAGIRLFCFPYMAGGASAFLNWSDFLPESIEVCAVQLPGREERSGESPLQSIDDIKKAFTDAALPLLDRPFAIYGHSIGAGLAFEVAKYLQKEKGLTAVRLFAGGWPAPDVESPFETIWGMDENLLREPGSRPHIIDHLRQVEIPEDVLSNATLIDEMLPGVIADIIVGKRYRYDANDRLSCPITAFAGAKDTVFPPEQLETWALQTEEEFNFHLLSGGHIFLRENRGELLNIIAKELHGPVCSK